MKVSRLKVEEMITRLVTEAVTFNRVHDGILQVLNCSGGDSKQWKQGDQLIGLDVAIELTLLKYKQWQRNIMAPQLDEIFYYVTSNARPYKKSSAIADEVIRAWNAALNVFDKIK